MLMQDLQASPVQASPVQASPVQGARRGMDRALARGHVNRFLDRLKSHDAFSTWPSGARLPCIALMFRETARAASPEVPLKRLKPLLAPIFPPPKVVAWNPRSRSELVSRVLTHATLSSILHPEDPGHALFDERAVFLSRVRLVRHAPTAGHGRGLVECHGGTTAGIGGHALQRLLEQGPATPETLTPLVSSLLTMSEILHGALEDACPDPDRPWSMLLPIAGGAAVAVTHRVRPWPGADELRTTRIASIRTAVREEMLTLDQQDRLSGCDDPLELRTRDPEAFAGWLRRNARPWDAPRAQLAAEPLVEDISPV